MTVRSTAPVDADGVLIQALRPLLGGAHHIQVGVASAVNSSAFATDTRAIEVYANTDCYFQTGSVNTVASSNDHFLPLGETRIYAIGGDKQDQHDYIAVIRSTEDGLLHVTELE